MEKLNIVYMGTPSFSVPALESLNEHYNVSMVVTQKDKPKGRGKKVQFTEVKEKALDLGLEVFQPDNINSPESLAKIKELEPDFIVVAAYGQILKKELLDLPKYKCINIHASLLPKYRGAAPINWSIVDGNKSTGITIMEMALGLDTGDMIVWEETKIDYEEDQESLYKRLSEIGARLIIDGINGIWDGSIRPIPQDDSKSTYAPRISKEMGLIDWSKPAQEIHNLVRGFKPWPSAYTDYNGETMKIHRSFYEEVESEGQVGEIIKVNSDNLIIKTGKGNLIVYELQFPNKKKMIVEDYLKGNSIDQGLILK